MTNIKTNQQSYILNEVVFQIKTIYNWIFYTTYYGSKTRRLGPRAKGRPTSQQFILCIREIAWDVL
jgi:hypothetical protein